MVHRREVEGEEIVLGNQGDLYQTAMTWWDHGTGSVWSQPRGEAILGPLAGTRLDLMSSTLTDWATWRERHPDTLALDAAGAPTGFELEEMVVVVELGGEAVGYPIPQVRQVGVVNDTVGGEPVAVVAGRGWAVFSREVGGRVVELTREGDRLVDSKTGSTWEAARGQPVAGPLGEPLAVLPAFTEFPHRFQVHFDGRLWTVEG